MKLIEVEGLDGAGKTTALKYLINQLKSKGCRVLETREVGSKHIDICVKLREIVLNPEYTLSSESMEFIFAAMRLESHKFYQSVKDQYDFIVSDRGWFSHLAYTEASIDQHFVDSLYIGLISDMTQMPDYTVYLDIDPKVGQQRMAKRNEKADAIEIKGTSFQEKVKLCFEKYMNLDIILKNTKVLTIDANLDIDKVEKQLDNVIRIITRSTNESTSARLS